MELLVDIGNTNLKWAFSERGALGPASTLRHGAFHTSKLQTAWKTLPLPNRILAANVAGEAAEEMLVATAKKLWGLSPNFVRTQTRDCGVTIAYETPQRLGVDRWLAMIGVVNSGKSPALILDCGTAVTLDAVDGSGLHLGGLILPGLSMMWHSLFAGTRIPSLPYQEHAQMLGKDTGECIAGGAVQAVAGATERVYRWLKTDRGMEPLVVLTGSDGEKIGAQLGLPHEYQPDLVLQGLTHLID